VKNILQLVKFLNGYQIQMLIDFICGNHKYEQLKRIGI